MIPVTPPSEPPDFERKCRHKGRAWLAKKKHPSDFPSFWSDFRRPLAAGFQKRCAYSAMYVSGKGHVDHFECLKNRPDLAYEWANYRFASGEMNTSKGIKHVLDPYDVQPGWFRIRLPSLRLDVTDFVPEKMRPLVEYTVQVLKLRDGEAVMDQRRDYFDAYCKGWMKLELLQKYAPLLAEAVEREGKERGKSPSGCGRNGFLFACE